ncbi:MAG: hypothetical protein V4507_16470, partial [Verrucomicrobiota bacterium]
ACPSCGRTLFNLQTVTARIKARTDHLKGMVLAAGRSADGVFFENAKSTVRLIFVIGTPRRMATEYLSVVGGLARLLRDE